jgi:hypothetical protein
LQKLAQMHLAKDDDVVHAFAPDRSDQPLGKAIQSARDDSAVDSVSNLGSYSAERHPKEKPR